MGLYQAPRHPYTAALLGAIPEFNRTQPSLKVRLQGTEIPSPASPPSGWRFRTRCPGAQQLCAAKEPIMMEEQSGRWVACHYPLTKD